MQKADDDLKVRETEKSDKTYYKMITEIVKKFVLWGSHVSLSLSRFNSASSFIKGSVMRLNKAFPATLVTLVLLAWNSPPFVVALLPTWHVLVHLALLSPSSVPFSFQTVGITVEVFLRTGAGLLSQDFFPQEAITLLNAWLVWGSCLW